MVKREVVSDISKRTGYSQKIVHDIIEAFFDDIAQELSDGNSVVVRGFGTFGVKKRAKRAGRNINTGEIVEIPEQYVPSFKPGANLKRAVSRLKG